MNQSKQIREAILRAMADGLTDRHDIYERVVKETEAPRPRVRREMFNLTTKKQRQREAQLNDRLITAVQNDKSHIKNFSQN